MRPIAERVERVPQVDMEVDGQLGRLPGLGETVEGRAPAPGGYGLTIGRPRHGPQPGLAEIGDRLSHNSPRRA